MIDKFYPYQINESIYKVNFSFISLPNADSAKPDQTQRFAASDQVCTVCQWSFYARIGR